MYVYMYKYVWLYISKTNIYVTLRYKTNTHTAHAIVNPCITGKLTLARRVYRIWLESHSW